MNAILRRATGWLLAALFPFPCATTRAASLTDFADYSYRNAASQVVLPGRLFTPPEAATDPLTPRPLMVYLHGGGAIGTDNVTQILQTPDYLVDEAKRRAAYLYVPQTPSGWASLTHVDAAMTMINRAVADRHADARRLYATGYSNGGGGTWNLLTRNRGRFAAALTVSAVSPAGGFNAANLIGTPVFALHARDDATVSVATTRNVMNSILAAAGEPRPTYLPASDPRVFLITNPQLPFHQAFVAGAPTDVLANHFLTRRDLDLLYYESSDGGHTGLLVAYYVPTAYEWMFSHALTVPEPRTMLLASCAWSCTLLRRRHC